MKRINQDIQEGKFSNLYLLSGEEAYLRNRYRDKLKNALSTEGDTLNTSYYSGKGLNIGEIIDLAETMPFLSERRVIIIEETDLFSSAAAGEQLADYISQIPDTTYFIFCEETVNKTYKLYKRIKANGYCAEFDRQTNADIRKWVLSIVTSENRKITNSAFEEFIAGCGNDMYLVKSELDKLLGYTYGNEAITLSDVRAICSARIEDKIFVMLDNIMNGYTDAALNLYGDLIALQEDPGHILSMIIRQLRLMMHVKVMNREGKSVGEMASALKVEGFVIKKLITQTRNVTRKSLEDAIVMCVQTEEDSRKGKIDIKIGVEIIIVSLSMKK